MRIGIDVRCFARGKNTGIEEYTQNALVAIFEADKENEYILFFNAWKNNNIDFSWATKYKNVTIKKFTISNKLLNFSLWFLQYPKIDKMCNGLDVFFMPNSNFYALSNNVKLIITIHDLSFEHYKNTFSVKRKLWHFFVNPRLLAKKANHIFTVSEATASDVCRTYAIDKKKVTATKNGDTIKLDKFDRNSINIIRIKEKYDLPYKFILYFGTIEPRKNIKNLIKAYNLLREQNDENKYKLVIAGAKGWKSNEIYIEAKKSKYCNDIIFIVDVPQDEKELLYKLAAVFVYPSLFEGFGFPPLEAISCDVPTVTSNRTSLPEVVGDNAILINPMLANEIAIAINEFINNKSIAKKMMNHQQGNGESWSVFARKFIKEI